jgi:hypothetical protein
MIRSFIVALGILTVSGSILAQSCHSGSSSSLHQKADKAKALDPVTQLKVQTKCPVMGNDIDSLAFTVWKGDEHHTPKKIYFCCPMCINTFKANPIKYIKKLEKQRQPIENILIEPSQTPENDSSGNKE